MYMLSLSFCGCGYHFHPDHHQFNGSGRKVGNKKLCTSRLIIDCGLFPEGARRPRILHLQRQKSSSSLLVYIVATQSWSLLSSLSSEIKNKPPSRPSKLSPKLLQSSSPLCTINGELFYLFVQISSHNSPWWLLSTQASLVVITV